MTRDDRTGDVRPPRVTAVIPAHNRPVALRRVLECLESEPVDQVIVVDNGSRVDLSPITELVSASLIRSPINVGVAARNLGARVADGELLLMLDDDSYPDPGTVEKMRDLFSRVPTLGALGGKVIDIDPSNSASVGSGDEVGSFDWFSRYGIPHSAEADGIPAFFAAEGACMIRRAAYELVGGFFEPYFHDLAELDLATRLIAAGWDVRYLPTASFRHMKSDEWRLDLSPDMRFRVRNQVWYFWRHFPPGLAVTRSVAYLAFDLVECLYQRVPYSWMGGLRDAWQQRAAVVDTRRPISRELTARVELHRGRAHAALLAHVIMSKLCG